MNYWSKVDGFQGIITAKDIGWLTEIGLNLRRYSSFLPNTFSKVKINENNKRVILKIEGNNKKE